MHQIESCPSKSVIYTQYGKRYFWIGSLGKNECLPKKKNVTEYIQHLVPEKLHIMEIEEGREYVKSSHCELTIREFAPLDIVKCGDLVTMGVIVPEDNSYLLKDISVSTHLPAAIRAGLQVIPDNIDNQPVYVLGPLYSVGGFQIGITGHSYRGESAGKTAIRESAEEVGRVPNNIENYRIPIRGDQSHVLFIVPLSDTSDPPTSGYLGNKNKGKIRVAVLIYGTANEIYDFITRKQIYHWESDDNIIGLVAIRVDTAKYLIDQISV